MTNHQQKVPKLRFPEFKGEWEEKTFRDVYSFHLTNSLSRAELNYENGSVKNIHYGDIHTKFKSNFDITKEIVPYINSEIKINKISNDSYCIEGDIIIADASEDYKDIGKTIEIINLNGQKLVAGLHTYIARPKINIAIGFSGYIMQIYNVRLQIMKMANGISVLGISKGNISKINLNFPSLPEQQKIADFLTAIDAKITQLQEKKSLLEKYKTGAMQQIFEQNIRFTDDHGNQYPDWEEKKLGDIAVKINSKNRNLELNNVLTNSAIQGIVSQNEYFDKDIANQSNLSGYYIVDINDFVYNPRISSNALVGSLKRNSLVKGIMSPLYTIFRFINGNLSFFEMYFETRFWHDYMKSVANSGARHDRLNITNEIFFGLILPFPSLPEQQKIADFLTAIDAKIEAVAGQIEQAKSYKKALLQQMFV